MGLTFKEKELVNIGASVATGCKPCTDFHFMKVREAGANDEEVQAAIADAVAVRDGARAIMQSHGMRHLGLAAQDAPPDREVAATRIKELNISRLGWNQSRKVRTSLQRPNVCVQIVDTGAGIPCEKRKAIFEPSFSRTGPRVKAGLGLFVSRQIVQRHQGRIELESEVGKGTTVTVILPRDAQEPSAVAPPAPAASPEERCACLSRKWSP